MILLEELNQVEEKWENLCKEKEKDIISDYEDKISRLNDNIT